MVNNSLIRELRSQCGLTQQQVAKFLHIDRSTYSYYELGRTNINIDILVRISRFYSVALDSLLNIPSQLLENREPIKGIVANFTCLSPREQTLVILCRSGSLAQREELLIRAREIVEGEDGEPPLGCLIN